MNSNILILTKSKMLNGYCVTGINTDNGEWIRLKIRGEDAFPKHLFKYPDGIEPKLMDCISVNLGKKCPTHIQPENVYVDSSIITKINNPNNDAFLNRLEDDSFEHTYLFFNDSYRISAEELENIGKEYLYSLQLVEIDELTVLKENEKKYVASFIYNNIAYENIRITDEDFIDNIGSIKTGNGIKIKGNLYLTVSLTEKFFNTKINLYEHYKLVASVLYDKNNVSIDSLYITTDDDEYFNYLFNCQIGNETQNTPAQNNPEEVLKNYYGFDSFKNGQEEVVNAILDGKDVLVVMPTGAGKSICYQIPAIIMPGITIVISPLIALMQDQVKALKEVGIRAAFINSTLSENEMVSTLNDITLGRYKLLYVAPERLENSIFLRLIKNLTISMIAVDEAHCISQWGQDFRPSYLKIVDFIKKLSRRPIVAAFTATATEEVKEDISCILNLNEPYSITTGFDRENLYFEVQRNIDKSSYVINYIKNNIYDSGIIYCSTRKSVDELYDILVENGFSVTKYHAGLDIDNRKKNQEDFIYDRVSVIVATNAFGMGINKSNVRYVIHYNMPQSIEYYYQEAGRAGRDGENANCILLFSPKDILTAKYLLQNKEFIDVEEENIPLIIEHDMRRLHAMENYCKTTSCLRNFILNYFGENKTSNCCNCGNCNTSYSEIDLTEQAKWVINCITETKGRYGQKIVIGTLLGANGARLKELGTINYKSYGKLKNESEELLSMLINQMISDKYIIKTDEKYSVLTLGDITPLHSEDVKVIVKVTTENKIYKENTVRKKKTDVLTNAGYDLFEILRRLRLEIARKESMPPYIIFSDKTLIDMAVKKPQNKEDMLDVLGVGIIKYEKYGEEFLECIKQYTEENPLEETAIQNDIIEIGQGIRISAEEKKIPFFITESEAENFEYKNFYYITYLQKELNRIATTENIKKVTRTNIYNYFESEELIKTIVCDDKEQKIITEKGKSLGIMMIEAVGSTGVVYKRLLYPECVQKMVVQYYIKH